ncbi:hypothetical protein PK28_17135 (plasmid) [Hymenobacter sp. DG25B]|nr:hypothetical protein PK28_17135 [Hymenobacter sp. DG25B]
MGSAAENGFITVSESNTSPLALMQPQQRAWLEAIYTRYQHRALSPTNANSSSFEKELEHFNDLWESLAYATSLPSATEYEQQRIEKTELRMKQRTERMQQLRQTRTARIRQHIEQSRNESLDRLKRMKSALSESNQHFEESSRTLTQLQHEYDALLQQQHLTYQQAVDRRMQKLGDELSQLADSLKMLWEKNESEAARLAEDEQSWSSDEKRLTESEKLTVDCHRRRMLLEAKKEHLQSWKNNLQQKKSALHTRRLLAGSSKRSSPGMFSNWKPASDEQRGYWLRKSKPLRELLRSYVQLSVRCQNLKAELSRGGFLSEDPLPERPAKLVDAPPGW